VIVDSSALLAIIRDEPMAAMCLQTLLGSPENRISAASYLEAAIVADRLPESPNAAMFTFDDLMEQLTIVIEPLTARQAFIAREAYGQYGKGSGHPARLKFGDCFAYALAKAFDEPLLFIGQDFVHTDVRRALP
jgi:ribonuclease VapC